MNPFDFILALFWVSLCVFLILFMSRRSKVSLAGVENRKPGIIGDAVYYTCKWITIVFMLFLGLHCLANWPPHWLERVRQRRIVFERVQNAGGWEIIKKDCNELVRSNATTGYQWLVDWPDGGTLPKSLAALKPHMVDLWPEKNGMCSVRIQIFGMHSTGGRGIDFYTLKVVCPWPANMPSQF